MTYSSKELAANKVDPMILALRKLRRKHGLIQAGLAAMLGIDETTLNRLETGKWPISVPMRIRLTGFASRWDPDKVVYLPPVPRARRRRACPRSSST